MKHYKKQFKTYKTLTKGTIKLTPYDYFDKKLCKVWLNAQP